MTTSGAALLACLTPLDRVRSAAFARAVRVPSLRNLLLNKERRVQAGLLIHASAAFLLAVFAPTFLLLAGPILFGIPHIVADVRYLALRPAYSTRVRRWLLGGSLGLVAMALARELGFSISLRTELITGAVFLFGVLSLAPRKVRTARSILALFFAATYALLSWHAPAELGLVLAHLHNPVALLFWAFLFTPRPATRGIASSLLLLPALILLGTPLAFFGYEHGIVSTFGFSSLQAADSLAPANADAKLSLGIVSSFAYLQSVHYAIWLFAIPVSASVHEAPSTVRRAVMRLKVELGAGGVALASVLILALLLAAVFRPLPSRQLYLSLAGFHGTLEFAALLLFLRSGASFR